MTFAQTRPASRSYFRTSAPVEGPLRQWIERAANFVVAYAELDINETLEQATEQESFIYLPDAGATIETAAEVMSCPAASVIIAPPGPYRLTMIRPGKVLRIFSSSERITELAQNAAIYADGATEVAPAIIAPAPPTGFRLRCYRLSNYSEKPMKMFRSSNLMINIFTFDGPRDPDALSPHYHDDFEQGSFAMAGEWVHSLRYPWSKRLADWQEDEHVRIGSPSLLIIPATVIHTSRSESSGPNQLVDIFSPPRRDFIDMGLTCNEADYSPLPAESGKEA